MKYCTSLRFKIVMALLLCSLTAVALVAGLAYSRMTYKVDSLRRQKAATTFQAGVTTYLQRYGSWDAGNRAQPFHRFMELQRQEQGGRGLPEGPDDWPPRNRPMQPIAGQPPFPPEDGKQPPLENPRYRFILANAQFQVLLGAGVYEPGELLPDAAREDAQPVVVKGQTLAYVSPQGVLTPSKQELEYLAVMREALLYGLAAASVVALGMGLALGSGLSSTLRRLTHAAQAMQAGALRQRVAVRGRDEVAVLASAFNQMSEELAHSHESLKASHQTIQEQADRLKEMSMRDALTGLFNRRHFDEHANMLFQQSLRHSHPMTVAIGDIDHFKHVNDQHSHVIGDAVLRQIGAILRQHMRASDLVARYGGEEFVIVLPETTLSDGAVLCEKLRNKIQDFPWHQICPDMKVSMSLGLSADLAAGSVQAMLQQADTLLYQAKKNGRNQVCFATTPSGQLAFQ